MIEREQLKMARAALGWSVRTLASRAGVTANTISRYENGADAYGRTLSRLQESLEWGGVSFLADTGRGSGVLLRRPALRLIGFFVDLSEKTVLMRVELSGRETDCSFSADILSRWDRKPYDDPGAFPGPEGFETAFRRHSRVILIRAENAILAGRLQEGKLSLTAADFPESGQVPASTSAEEIKES